jgi:hypothetical protein
MKNIFLIFFLVLVSCNRNSGSSSDSQIPNPAPNDNGTEVVGPQVDIQVEAAAKAEATNYMNDVANEIPENLKIQSAELSTWKDEGILTQEEELEISQNINQAEAN